MRSDDVEVSTIIFVNGVPFEQLVEHNGLPPSLAEQRKQKDQLNKLKGETPEERPARPRQEEEDNTSLIREVPLAFNFGLIGEELASPDPAIETRLREKAPFFFPNPKAGHQQDIPYCM